MTLTVLTPPAGEPVSLDEAKAFLRVTIDAEDALIASLITAARQQVELETGLAMLSTTFRQTKRLAPDEAVALLRGPLASIEAASVGGGALDPSYYKADTGSLQPRLKWLKSPPAGVLEIDYVAGFGDAAAVPEMLRQAILTLVAWAFDHRGEGEPPPGLTDVWLKPFRQVRL